VAAPVEYSPWALRRRHRRPDRIGIRDLADGELRLALYPYFGESLSSEFRSNGSSAWRLTHSMKQIRDSGCEAQYPTPTYFLRFSPDDRAILASHPDCRRRIAQTGHRRRGSLLWPRECIRPFRCMSPDGSRVALAFELGNEGVSTVRRRIGGTPVHLPWACLLCALDKVQFGRVAPDDRWRGRQDAVMGRAAHPPAVNFDFADSQENWSYGSADPFDAPLCAYQDTGGGLLVAQANNNTNTFGYWTSPVLDLGDFGGPEGFSPTLLDVAAPNHSSRRSSNVKTSVTDSARVPQLRVAHEHRDVRAERVSRGRERRDRDRTANPRRKKPTRSCSRPHPGIDRVTFSFDLINFDSEDDPQGDLQLDWVTITRRDPGLPAGRLLAEYSFEDGTDDWASATAAEYAAPEFFQERVRLRFEALASARRIWVLGVLADRVADSADRRRCGGRTRRTDAGIIPKTCCSRPKFPRRVGCGGIRTGARVPQFRLRLTRVRCTRRSGRCGRESRVGETFAGGRCPQDYAGLFPVTRGLLPQAGLLAAFDYINLRAPRTTATAPSSARRENRSGAIPV